MSQKMIAFCGLDCATCPYLFASKRLSMEKRQELADQMSKRHKANIQAADVDCVGCAARDGVHLVYCSVCEMRQCGLAKGLRTCADCPEFACSKLEAFFGAVPAAKANLTELRAK